MRQGAGSQGAPGPMRLHNLNVGGVVAEVQCQPAAVARAHHHLPCEAGPGSLLALIYLLPPVIVGIIVKHVVLVNKVLTPWISITILLPLFCLPLLRLP